MGFEGAELCEDCAAPLERGQRYCLACGARVGSRSPELLEVLRRVDANLKAADRAAGGAGGAGGAGALGDGGPTVRRELPSRPRILAPMSSLRLPPAKISVLLVLVFLGFGALLGDAAAPPGGSLAASAHPLQVVVPRASTPAGSSPQPGAAAAKEPAGEAPEAESTTAPAPPARPTTAAAQAPAVPGASAQPAPTSAGEGTGPGGAGGATSKLPPIKHVFVIMLSEEPYAAVFGPASAARYLTGSLEPRGALLVRYDAVAHEQLANEVALISGQGPTVETAANCPTYADIAPATPGAAQQVLGNGCVYPRGTQTLAGQLSAKHLTWRAYVEGFGEPGSQTAACGHPVPGQPDPAAGPTPAAGAYATFRNPFLYFHSITDSRECAADDVGIDRLARDLSAPGRTPSFAYIVPDRCNDGSPNPCAPGAAAGLAPADAFLKRVVPEITRSHAYRDAGLLVVTVDEAPSSGEFADSSSCCGQPQYPNLPPPSSGLSRRGGGTVGALLLSPFVKGASTSQEPYSHFSLLRTIEDLFGLRHLGYAAGKGVSSFETSLFSGAPRR